MDRSKLQALASELAKGNRPSDRIPGLHRHQDSREHAGDKWHRTDLSWNSVTALPFTTLDSE